MGDRALAVTEILAEREVFYDYEFEICRRRLAPCDSGARASATPTRRRWTSRSPRIARWAAAVPACRLPLRRHRGRARPAGAAGGQHAARPDADLAAARAGGACGHEFPAALRLDGGERRMPRVSALARATRSTIGRRGCKLLLRRSSGCCVRRPGSFGAAGRASVVLAIAVHSGGAGRRARYGCASGLLQRHRRCRPARDATCVIEGRANTPEPLLRAALGVHVGDPILGFSLTQATGAHRDDSLGASMRPSSGACPAPSWCSCRSGGRSRSGRTRATSC